MRPDGASRNDPGKPPLQQGRHVAGLPGEDRVSAVRPALLLVALLSGGATLCLLLLPFWLAMLLLVFEDATHALLSLFGLVLGWLLSSLPGAGSAGLPAFQALARHPASSALLSLVRALPCLLGLLLMLMRPRVLASRPAAGAAAACWLISLPCGGRTAALLLLPGLLAAAILAGWPRSVARRGSGCDEFR
jgi:hypothetical protein